MMDYLTELRASDAETLSSLTSRPFESMLLNPSIIRKIKGEGYPYPKPIQSASIPLGLLGKDLLVQSQHGTGKTLVYATLIAQHAMDGPNDGCVAVLVTPDDNIEGIKSMVNKLLPENASISTYVKEDQYQSNAKTKSGCLVAIGTPSLLKKAIMDELLNLEDCSLIVLHDADKLTASTSRWDLDFVHKSLNQEKIQIAAFTSSYPLQLDSFLTRYMKAACAVRLAPPKDELPLVPSEKASESLKAPVKQYSSDEMFVIRDSKQNADELLTYKNTISNSDIPEIIPSSENGKQIRKQTIPEVSSVIAPMGNESVDDYAPHDMKADKLNNVPQTAKPIIHEENEMKSDTPASNVPTETTKPPADVTPVVKEPISLNIPTPIAVSSNPESTVNKDDDPWDAPAASNTGKSLVDDEKETSSQPAPRPQFSNQSTSNNGGFGSSSRGGGLAEVQTQSRGGFSRGGFNSSSRGGGFAVNDGFESQNQGEFASRGGFSSRGQSRGGFASQGGFEGNNGNETSSRGGGFSSRGNGFASQQRGGFSSRGGFAENDGVQSQGRGGFSSRGGFGGNDGVQSQGRGGFSSRGGFGGNDGAQSQGRGGFSSRGGFGGNDGVQSQGRGGFSSRGGFGDNEGAQSQGRGGFSSRGGFGGNDGYQSQGRGGFSSRGGFNSNVGNGETQGRGGFGYSRGSFNGNQNDQADNGYRGGRGGFGSTAGYNSTNDTSYMGGNRGGFPNQGANTLADANPQQEVEAPQPFVHKRRFVREAAPKEPAL